MADKSIEQLQEADRIYTSDLFVLQQANTAKRLPAQVLLNWLTAAADGHGGIKTISRVGSIGVTDTYRITLADNSTVDYSVVNGVGITGISKVSTSGRVDTYRISLSDGSSSTFTVTNGSKGDKGDAQYVHIRYASQKPTVSAPSFGTLPDDWMGVYSGASAEAPTSWNQYTWFRVVGAQGNPGLSASLISSEVRYATSANGDATPSGTWVPNPPPIQPGEYLWTRVTQTFNTGEPIVFYSVSRAGRDGADAGISEEEVRQMGFYQKPLTGIPATDLDAEAIPNKLPNPYGISFTGAVNISYDGSSQVIVPIPSSDTFVSKTDYAPEEKTAAMTQPVGKDASGRLWTAPTGGGSGSGGDSGAVVEIQADLDEMKSQIGNVRTAYSEYADLTPGEYVNSGIRGNLGEMITVTTSTSYFYYVLDNIYDKYLISTRIGKSTNYPHYIYGVDKDGVIVQTDLPSESTGRPVYKHTFIPNKDVAKIYVMLYLNTTVSYAAGAKLEFKPFQDQIDETLSIGRAGLRPARWLAMGDSITEGWFSQLSDTNEAISSQPTGDSANWVKIVAAFGGFEVTNNGIGGSGWVDKGSASYPSPSAREQIDGNWKGKEPPVLASYDLVTLALGLNDWKGAVDFGTWEDDILTADTVIANMRYVIEKITEANPNCKIIGISPMNCKYGSASKASNWAMGCSINGKTLEEAWAIMKGVYDHYNIETIDMLHGSSLNRNNLEALLIDGIHPSEKGHQLIGRELARKINFC